MEKRNQRKTTDSFKQEIWDLVGDEFTLLTEYVNTKTHVDMRHEKCGNIISVRPYHFLGGIRCRHCSYKEMGKHRRRTTEEVSKTIDKEGNGEYLLVSEYKKSNTKISIKHKTCGNTFKMKYRFFVNMGQRCPICRLSKGEEEIKRWLESKDMKYDQGKRFDDCRDIRPLPFDFIVYRDNIMYAIEYDGVQHFNDSFMEGYTEEKDSLYNIQRRDEIKNNYCKDNNIPLLRIPYTEYDNISVLLSEFLVN